MADTTARIRLALEGQGQVVQGMKQVEDGTASLRRSMASLVGALSLGAAVSQITQMTREFANAGAELARFSALAGTVPEQFQKLAFASSRFGIQQEKLADILKDVQDKVGDFLQTGAGPLADFFEKIAPSVGVTADQFKRLGGADALQLYVSSLEKANLSQSEMTFYMEAIASDSTLLLPLLRDNGKAFGELSERAERLGLVLREDTIKATVEFQGNLREMEDTAKGATNTLLGALVPALNAVYRAMKNAFGDNPMAEAADSVLELNRRHTILTNGMRNGFYGPNAAAELADVNVKLDAAKARFRDLDAQRRQAAILDRANVKFSPNDQYGAESNRLGLTRTFIPGVSAKDAAAAAKAAEREAAKRQADETREAERALTEERRRSADVVELRNRLAGEGYAAEQKNIEAARESNRELVQRYENSAASAAQRLTDLQNEADAVAYAEKYQIGMAQAVEITTIARLKEQQVAALGNEAIVLQLQKEIEARGKIVGMLDSKAARDAGAELRKNEAAEWAKTWDQVGQSFTDALMEGGKSVKQYLEGLFRTMVLRPLLDPITTSVGSLLGGPAAVAGQAGGAGSGIGMLGNLKSAYSAMTGGFGSLAASLAGSAALAVSIGRSLSGGYNVGSSRFTDVLSLATGGVASGVVNRLFGRKAPVSTGSGITGEFSTSGASVQGYNDLFSKGGLFRSNKRTTEYTAVSSDLDSFLDQSLVSITGATRDYATLLGLNADAVNGATQSIRLSLAGLNAEQQQTAILGALSGFGDVLAGRVLAGDGASFIRNGETASTALTRLATSLTTVNVVFDTLNATLLKGSLIGADAASKLLDAFGGAEAFANQTSAYYEAFYSQAERTSTATRQLTEVLAGLGLALPESRTAFRELVEAQDLYTDAGRSTYAALIGLAPVFNEITQATEQMGKALSDEVLRLRGLLTGSSVNSVGALQGDFAIATAAARAGDAGALERLPAISQALESAAALQAVTAADLAIVRGQLTASLSQTMQALGLDVPQFAVGTNYVPRDMLARIHEGEAIIPKAYNPAAGGNDAMVAELRAVRAELEGLRAEVRADVGHNAKTARILERVTPDGTSLSTVVAA